MNATERAVVAYLKHIHPDWGFKNIPALLAEAIAEGEHRRYLTSKKKKRRQRHD